MPTWFLLCSCFSFPVVLLLVASLQPAFLRDPTTNWRLFSLHVFWLHFFTFLGVSMLVLGGLGRLRPADLGLKLSDVPIGLFVLLVVWCVQQAVMLCLMPYGLAELRVNQIWLSPDWIRSVSSLVANTLGTGLNEETFFRGYVFVQLYLLLSARRDHVSWNVAALLGAAVLSSLLFAALHFRTNPLELLQLSVGGLVGASLYARTKNLTIGIGLHGLFNSPMPLFECSNDTAKTIVLLLLIVVIAVWPYCSQGASRLLRATAKDAG